MFENFVAFNFNEGLPSISVTKNGLTFSKGVVMKMDYPEYVVLLIDKSGKQIAIKASEKGEENSVEFCTPEKREKKGVLSIRWNQRDLLNTISSMMDWDLKHFSYKCEGTLIEEERAILFNLMNSKELK